MPFDCKQKRLYQRNDFVFLLSSIYIIKIFVVEIAVHIDIHMTVCIIHMQCLKSNIYKLKNIKTSKNSIN